MNHPITPSPELVQQWWEEADQYQDNPKTYFDHVATEAARWGADQEMKACTEWLAYEGHEHEHLALRAARRPKPPSLKKQALLALDLLISGSLCSNSVTTESTIRRALEALPE